MNALHNQKVLTEACRACGITVGALEAPDAILRKIMYQRPPRRKRQPTARPHQVPDESTYIQDETTRFLQAHPDTDRHLLAHEIRTRWEMVRDANLNGDEFEVEKELVEDLAEQLVQDEWTLVLKDKDKHYFRRKVPDMQALRNAEDEYANTLAAETKTALPAQDQLTVDSSTSSACGKRSRADTCDGATTESAADPSHSQPRTNDHEDCRATLTKWLVTNAGTDIMRALSGENHHVTFPEKDDTPGGGDGDEDLPNASALASSIARTIFPSTQLLP